MIKIVFRFIHDKIFGWKLCSKPPKVKKAVLIAYPHTSYYDGFYLLFASVFLPLFRIRAVNKLTSKLLYVGSGSG